MALGECGMARDHDSGCPRVTQSCSVRFRRFVSIAHLSRKMGDRVLLDRDCLKGAVHPKVIGALSLLSGEKRTQCKSGVAHDVKGGDDDVRGPLVPEETTTKTRVVDYMLPYCRL